jgi:uncharacterized membrane protein
MRPFLRILLSAAVLLPAAGMLAARASGQAAPGSPPHRLGVHIMRSAKAAAASSHVAGPPNMVYNGGAVLPSTTTYAIWWGKRSDFPPDAVEGIDELLSDLDGSDFLHIADQYLFGQRAHTRFGGNLFDPSAPTEMPVDAQFNDLIYPEVFKVLQANGLKPDPTAIYAVYTSNFPAEAIADGFCAFHTYDFSPDGAVIHLAYMPNSASVPAYCGTDFDAVFKPNSYSEPTRAVASATGHEFMETITDPNGDAWYNANFSEIGDPCAYIYQTWVPLRDDKWKIQMIWSNQVSGCVQGAGREGRVLGASVTSKTFTDFTLADATYGIFAYGVNTSGRIAGFYTDANNVFHAFLRDTSGKTSNIDPPGTVPGFLGGAEAFGINAGGAITGFYFSANFLSHGFIRDNLGTFVTIDVPSAGVIYGTVAQAINAEGVTTGNYSDANFANHGFIRDEHGAVGTFDAPGVDHSLLGRGTIPLSINGDGAITGYYLDANSVIHGFVRDEYGSITTFDAPGASNVPGTGTKAFTINDDGEIVGYYTDAQHKGHGYVRDRHGLITTFNAPNAVYGTYAESINSDGSVAGYYMDSSGFPRGFVRDKYGNFTTIDSSGTSYGTVLLSINDNGVVAGYNTVPTP